uniref:ATP-dependent RNA helicase DHX34 n=1 Tax=Bursaphelenchus xylophilus TaxID=6326 RepID=A0A1I7ST19_BURXY
MGDENKFAFSKYKSRLIKTYFTDSGVFPSTSTSYQEFTTFINGLEKKTDQKFFKGLDKNKAFTKDDLGVVQGCYDRGLDSRFRVEETVVDRFLVRDIPNEAIKQFEYVIKLFLEFINWKKMRRVTQMRQTQANLPIAASRNDIIKILDENQVLILAGDTGCGKSTQVPQYFLQAGYRKIACTQPRRIACTALAKRVAHETLNIFGSEVAFQTRFEKTKTNRTRLLFLTDGLLVRQMLSDPLLSQYDVIILDEVHERHLGGDLLVALMKMLIQRRSDLKLVLMSATINIDLFSGYFEGAPVVQVPGRLFPIEVQYMPVKEYDIEEKKKSCKIDSAPYLKILQMIDNKYAGKERGDMLIFLNGIGEIQMLADALKEYADYSKRWIILMLHSTLSVEEQNKVFDIAPSGVRKCILSTNIAETSVTIDGIRFVVDSGKVNLLKFDTPTRSHRLAECWISRASADQRKGRAGRTGPGICYRLYSQAQMEKMDAFTPSEIKRVSLESLIMQILNMGLEMDVRDFPFLEEPNPEALKHALEIMIFQGVVDPVDSKRLTPLGTILATLPVDLLIGKMLVYGVITNEIDVILTVAAGLSVQSAFTNRSFRDYDTVQNRNSLLSDIGDAFTLIKVFREWIYLRRKRDDTKKWCRKCGIEESRLLEIVKLRRQFRQILEQAELLNTKVDKEWENLSSKERKIKLGEKRKLNLLKRKAQHQTKTRKYLKEGQHFDTILDQNDEDGPQDDINSLEFQVLVDDNEITQQLRTHKLDHDRSLLVQFIISMGLYPQFAIEDAHNNHRTGSEQFAHCATKPFAIIHPNSSLTPESLEIHKEKDGSSSNHQLIFYGLLLETIKPFLCNNTRTPALFLVLFCRNLSGYPNSIVFACI